MASEAARSPLPDDPELAAFQRAVLNSSFLVMMAAALFCLLALRPDAWALTPLRALSLLVLGASAAAIGVLHFRPLYAMRVAMAAFGVGTAVVATALGLALYLTPRDRSIAENVLALVPYFSILIVWSHALFSSRAATVASIVYTAVLALVWVSYLVLDGTQFETTVARNAMGQAVIFSNIGSTLLMLVISNLNREVAQSKLAKARMEEFAFSDALTGLPNRRSLQRLLEKELSRHRRHGGAFSVALVDIDHFKRINDKHGHDVGDRALQATASLLRAQLGPADWVGRWGGEEFLIVWPDRLPADVLPRLDAIRQALAAQRAPGLPALTASFGLTGPVAADPDFRGLLQRADEALYRAKGAGRNRVVLA